MSIENMSLEDIKNRRGELADKKQELDAVKQEEQELEFQEFSLKMRAIEEARASAKSFEESMAKSQADLVIIAYQGSKTTKVDLKNDTVRAISGLPGLRKNLVTQMVLYMKQKAKADYMLLIDGNNHLLSRYNTEKREAAKREKLQKAQ